MRLSMSYPPDNHDLKHLPSHLSSLAKELLPVLLQSSKEVVADAQFVINHEALV